MMSLMLLRLVLRLFHLAIPTNTVTHLQSTLSLVHIYRLRTARGDEQDNFFHMSDWDTQDDAVEEKPLEGDMPEDEELAAEDDLPEVPDEDEEGMM